MAHLSYPDHGIHLGELALGGGVGQLALGAGVGRYAVSNLPGSNWRLS
jgi:hypothetical protein